MSLEHKSFIIKGRGSSVVEQPIRNRQVASSTLALGSNLILMSWIASSGLLPLCIS